MQELVKMTRPVFFSYLMNPIARRLPLSFEVVGTMMEKWSFLSSKNNLKSSRFS